VEVFVEDLPPPDQPSLLGLYHGVPLSSRGRYAGSLPVGITLFRVPIERLAVAAFTVPTEAHGTLEWDSTTVVVVEVEAAGGVAISYFFRRRSE